MSAEWLEKSRQAFMVASGKRFFVFMIFSFSVSWDA